MRNANVDGFFVWSGVPEVAGHSRITRAESEVKRQRTTAGIRTCTFWTGTHKVRSFAKGQGRGWPWSKTHSCHRLRPGGENGKHRHEELRELLNITSRCITRSRHKVDSEDCSTHHPKADSGLHRSREELYNVVLCYDADSWHRR